MSIHMLTLEKKNDTFLNIFEHNSVKAFFSMEVSFDSLVSNVSSNHGDKDIQAL